MKELNTSILTSLLKELNSDEILPQGFKLNIYQLSSSPYSFTVTLVKDIKFDPFLQLKDNKQEYIVKTLWDEIIKPLDVGGLKKEIELLEKDKEALKEEIQKLEKFKLYYDMHLLMTHGKKE